MFYCLFALIAIFIIVYLLYKLGTVNYDLFEKQGLKYIKPLPFFGSTLELFKGTGLPERILNNNRKFPNEKVIGLFELGVPTYVLRSPDILRQIAVKNFNYFEDRMALVHESLDDYVNKMVLSLCGKEWRDMRTTLSPMFTGSKLRTMLPLIVKCSQQLVDFLHNDFDKNGLTSYSIKDIFSKYSNDAIVTCAFGVECNSLEYPDNETRKLGQGLLNYQRLFAIHRFILMRYLLKIAKFFGVTPVDNVQEQKFTDLILKTMDFRKKEGIVRPDLVQMIMKIRDGQACSLRKNGNHKMDEELEIINGNEERIWSDTDLLAQAFMFYGAGVDTSSTAMIYGAYELAVHLDIQERLAKAIQKANENVSGPLNYEALQRIKYLDMVVTEILRKWTPAVFTDRICSKDYCYEDNEGPQFLIKRGSYLMIPIYGIHMDPKHYPDPDNFDPERFNDNNKTQRDVLTYLPFGIGPRSCIGERLAIMNMKTVFYHILLHFRIKVCEETDIPLKFKSSLWTLQPAKEIKLCMEPRHLKSCC